MVNSTVLAQAGLATGGWSLATRSNREPERLGASAGGRHLDPTRTWARSAVCPPSGKLQCGWLSEVPLPESKSTRGLLEETPLGCGEGRGKVRTEAGLLL